MVSIPPGSRLGRYQVVEQIGRGGMATVFRAYDPELNRHVAVKVLPSFQVEDPTFVERFRQEAQSIARLNHPNIIQVYDFGEDKGFTFIVMEYVTGGTLSRHVTNALPLEEVLEWVSPIAQALEYAHSQSIIHRDIKPANVLVDASGKPKLSDFGLARLLEGSAGLTSKNAVLGTPAYMAPEQALGRPADQKSDLYSLGVIIYQMLVGQVPFRGDTPSETLMAHIHQPVPLPTVTDPQFDARLEAILIRALSKDPDARYATADKLIQALSSASVGGDTGEDVGTEATVAEQVLARAAGERTAQRRLPLGLAVLLIALGVTLLGTTGIVLFASIDFGERRETGPGVAPIPAGALTLEKPATPSPKATPGTSGSAASMPGSVLSTIFQRVHAIRELEPVEQVVPNFVSSAELRDLLLEAERRRKEAVVREQAVASMLGLIPEDLDLVQLGLDTVDEPFQQGSGRTAWYDRESQELYIRDRLVEITSFGELGIFDEFEIVVGYAMALLQQHFDIGALEKKAKSDLDRRHAFEALVIGDANTVGQEYMSAHISPDRFAASPPTVRASAVENAPEFVRRRALFAPQGGTNFIAALRKTGQWEAMRLVYRNPPASTEQIIHPDNYLEGDEPVVVTLPDFTDALGSGWVDKYNGVMGESFLRAYLALLSKVDSIEAAAGWGGDRFSLLEGPSSERTLVALFAWDTAGDANEFLDLVTKNTGQTGRRAFLDADEDSVLLVLGPEKAVEAIRAQFDEF